MFAAASKSLDTVKVFMDNGADLHARAENSMTVLMFATKYDTADVIEYLVSVGADVDERTKDNETALHLASVLGITSCMEALIRLEADVNAVEDKDGYTPLMYAAANGHLNAVEMLLDAGADANIKALNGLTILEQLEKADSGYTLILSSLRAAAKPVE